MAFAHTGQGAMTPETVLERPVHEARTGRQPRRRGNTDEPAKSGVHDFGIIADVAVVTKGAVNNAGTRANLAIAAKGALADFGSGMQEGGGAERLVPGFAVDHGTTMPCMEHDGGSSAVIPTAPRLFRVRAVKVG